MQFLKILTFNGDNATSNDKQTTHLHALPNSFDQVNRVRCFNHTIQLSAKKLLEPFTSATDANDPEDKGDVVHPTGDANIALASMDGLDFDISNEDTEDDPIEDPSNPGDDEDDHEDDKGKEIGDDLMDSRANV